MFKFRYFGFLFILLIVAAISYKLFFSNKPGQSMAPAAGAMPASFATVIEKEVEVWNEFSGRMQATDKVEIHPQVGGTLEKILFEEGTLVKKGDPLFVIDQRKYVAELQRAEAAVTAARSQVEFTSGELKRAESLVKTSVITQSKYDERLSSKLSAESNLKASEAAVNLARLNVEYSNIRAPISGRISRAEVTVGNIVDPAQPQAMATIVSIDPIYAEFNIDEQTYLKFVDISNGNTDVTKIPVQISLAGENAPTVNGYMKSFDNQLDNKTGTIRARATFDNKDGKLVPGLFAKVRLGSTSKRKAVLITDRAIGTDQDKKFVYVINAENKTEYRPIKLGSQADGLRIIESGLQAGEKVIVSGLFKFRPDMPVTPSEVPMEGTENMAQNVNETGAQNKDVQKIGTDAEKSKDPSAPANKIADKPVENPASTSAAPGKAPAAAPAKTEPSKPVTVDKSDSGTETEKDVTIDIPKPLDENDGPVKTSPLGSVPAVESGKE